MMMRMPNMMILLSYYYISSLVVVVLLGDVVSGFFPLLNHHHRPIKIITSSSGGAVRNSRWTTITRSLPSSSSSSSSSVLFSSQTTTSTKGQPPPPIVRIENKNELIELAHDIVYTKSGFYSPIDESVFADDFVFRGPVIGPLNKKDYKNVMNTFQIYQAIPDINPNAFGYTIDPTNTNRVWFFVRNTGTFTGQPGLGLGYGQYIPPNNKPIRGCIETLSILFDEKKQMKHLTVGYVSDRYDPNNNTNGLGAALGIFTAIGIPLPPSGTPILRLLQWFTAEVLDADAKTYSKSDTIPSWWTSTEKCADGYK